MHLLRNFLLLSFLTSPIAAAEKNWPSSNLTLELSNYVPLCAEICFISFLKANFGLKPGQKIPSLQELCSTNGDTAFTVGEGAVQCIAAEKSIDGCPDKDVTSSVIYNAYQMCSGQPGAIAPTHAVITATLVLPPSGVGPVSFPAPSIILTTRSSKSTGLPSTLVVDTRPLTTATPSASSTLITTIRTSLSSGTRPAAETSTAAVAVGETTHSGSLTPLQKAGISVGVVGFAIVAVGFLLLFRLYRAKMKRGHESLDAPSGRGFWGYKLDKSNEGSSTGDEPPWMPNPIHTPHDHNGAWSIPPITSTTRSTTLRPPPAVTATAPVGAAGATELARESANGSPNPIITKISAAPQRAYNRTSWRPSAIGLAITPATSNNASPTPTCRPLSKLLPAKPLLETATSKELFTPPTRHADMNSPRHQSDTPSPTHAKALSYPPVLPKLLIPQHHDDFLRVPGTTNKPRESTMTEFEEDGRESSSISPEGQIWQPPSAVPLSAATYYVADKHGNWVLGDVKRISQTAEQEGTTPLSAYPELATSMTILPVLSNKNNEDHQQQLAAATTNATFQPPGTSQAGIHASSYHRPTARRSLSVPNAPPPAHQSIRVVTEPLLQLQDVRDSAVPRPLFSSSTNGNINTINLVSARRSSGRSLTRPRAQSADSGITTITNSPQDDSDTELPNVRQIGLSPVVESPRSGTENGNGRGRSPVQYPRIPGRDKGTTGTPANLARSPSMSVLLTATEQKVNCAPDMPASTTFPSVRSGVEAVSRYVPLKDSRTPTIKPFIPVTKAISPTNSSARAMPRPVQDPALLRTGSPTLRLVQPSPEPEDDRTNLPSARPRNSIKAEQSVSSQQSQFATNSKNCQTLEQRHPYESRLQKKAAQRQRQTSSPGPIPQDKSKSRAHFQSKKALNHQSQMGKQDRLSHPNPQSQQADHESQFEEQQQQTRRPLPNWIPGLPTHPHPQRRTQHTSTFWLPPQARSTRKVETEPDHHQFTPKRAHQHAQQSLSGVFTQPQAPTQVQGESRSPPRLSPVRSELASSSVESMHSQQQPQAHLHPQNQANPSMPTSFLDGRQSFHPSYLYPTHREQQDAYPYEYLRCNKYDHYSRFHRAPYMPPRDPHQCYPENQQPFMPNVPASLLAKRLGPQRAANLSVSTDLSSHTWHRCSSGYLSPDTVTSMGQTQGSIADDPLMPIWLPTLMPTRRGADLYLNVR